MISTAQYKKIMKRILLIATGGTIACKQTASGLAPQLGAKELLSYVRDRAENVESIELFRMDSSNVQPEEWRAIAQAVADNMHKADGIVITPVSYTHLTLPTTSRV